MAGPNDEQCIECGDVANSECEHCDAFVCGECYDDHCEWEHGSQESEL